MSFVYAVIPATNPVCLNLIVGNYEYTNKMCAKTTSAKQATIETHKQTPKHGMMEAYLQYGRSEFFLSV